MRKFGSKRVKGRKEAKCCEQEEKDVAKGSKMALVKKGRDKGIPEGKGSVAMKGGQFQGSTFSFPYPFYCQKT